jgi:nucleotide-binding universal stress UspA family protein
MTSDVPSVVVAGIDGSFGSRSAARAAAWEARARSASLLLMNVAAHEDDQPSAGEVTLADAAARLRKVAPDLPLSTRVEHGGASAALIRASADAALLVVGARGSGGFAGLSVGSVAAQTAAHARCPVLVIRPPEATPEPNLATTAGVDDDSVPPAPRPGHVLVGVDGSAESEAALRFAFEEASLRRVGLVVQYVWFLLPEDGVRTPGAADTSAAEQDAQRVITEMAEPWAQVFPDVSVLARPERAMKVSYSLIEASRTAGLVVVGSRGRGGFTGLLLGSTGRDLVGHAHSPVAVVH